ncbi:MAG: hypothetical protein QOH31_3557 [Verrucomicrobiota bacterium]
MWNNQQPDLFPCECASTKALTVLSYGAGQESTWLLYQCALSKEFKRRFAPGRLLVLGSDTGDEHDETYEHIHYTRKFCLIHGLDFVWIEPSMGFHSVAWSSLVAQYRRNDTIGSLMFKRCCTDNLKIQPFYRFLASWLHLNYRGVPYERNHRSRTFHAFAGMHGKINVMIGFAANELERKEKTLAGHSQENGYVATFRKASVEFTFPLIDLGMDRAATQASIRAMGLPLPPPSNCKRCHFRRPVELLWLYRFERNSYDEWVELEKAKIEKFAERTAASGQQNCGVFGSKLIPQVLEEAMEKYGAMSDEALHEFRMSHGHCVSNGY